MTPYLNDEDAQYIIGLLLDDIYRREEAGAQPVVANRILSRFLRLTKSTAVAA